MTSTQAILSRKLQSPDYNDKYKTELCRNWMAGFCSFESKCVFAHGKEELRLKTLQVNEDFTIPESTVPESDQLIKPYSKKRLPVFIELSRGVQ